MASAELIKNWKKQLKISLIFLFREFSLKIFHLFFDPKLYEEVIADLANSAKEK
jgi:hypothetical protein